MGKRIRKIVIILLVNILLTICLLFLFEGIAGFILVVQAILHAKPVAERSHTEYDEEIGWINLPNVYVKDMFGPGKFLKTNSQRFRNQEDFTPNIPDGKVRILCSGDSFTFGYGVSNDHAWCQQLTLLNRRLQTVNMALGGYGIDQMYLWFMRNNGKLEYDIHVFAFITEDFLRMTYNRFLGYGKPVIDLQDDTLVVKNVPVPKRFLLLPYRFKGFLETLHLVRLLKSITSSLQGTSTAPSLQSRPPHEIALTMFEKLHQQASLQENRLFVAVYLPIRKDYQSNGTTQLRHILQERASRDGWIFLDLVEDFKKLPPQQALNFFITEADTQYSGGVGHYNEAGNVYIANMIYKHLSSLPGIAVKLHE